MPAYPQSVHCRFDGYPKMIQLVAGSQLASESGFFSAGSIVILRQTPLSGQIQGGLEIGSELPPKRIIYTDSGEDDSFNLKVAYDGWGTFIDPGAEEGYYKLQITKRMAIQAGDWDEEKLFQHKLEMETRIPLTTDLAGVEPPATVAIKLEEIDPPGGWGSDWDYEEAYTGGEGGGSAASGQDCSRKPWLSNGNIVLPGGWKIKEQKIAPEWDAEQNIKGYHKYTKCSCFDGEEWHYFEIRWYNSVSSSVIKSV